ncbi:MAG: prephenate dehydratase [Planctomycetota bacterium]
MPESTLDALRVSIDDVDRRLVEQINRRASLEIESYRADHLENDAVSHVETDWRHHGIQQAGPIPDTALNGIYREILNASYTLARRIRVGYLGPEGTFSHQAAEEYFGDAVDYENLRALSGVFEEVARGHVQYGLVPIENSTGGAIIETLDSFAENYGRVTVRGEIQSSISFNLLGNCKPEDVEEIHSKGEALAQCYNWLVKHYPDARRIESQSTAAAARFANLAAGDGVAAIGSSKAGQLYELKTIQQNIEDNPNNVTRFLILSQEPADPTGNDKTSLMFTCDDRPGSLVDILSVFQRHGINLSHIEKRPSQQIDSEYTFFVDMLGHVDDGPTSEILGEARAHCKSMFVLGSYPVFQAHQTFDLQRPAFEHPSRAERQRAIEVADRELVDLINQRARLVIEVGHFKRKSDVPIYAPHREAAVLKKIKSLNTGPLPDQTLEAIYRELMSGSFALEKPLRIGFLGPEGEFSHLAAIRQFGSSVTFDASTEIRNIFTQIIEDQIDYGLVPIENSSIGGVNETLDSFIDLHQQLTIYGEVKLQIHYCLLAACRPDQVREIYSTASVIQQCRNWISTQYPHVKIHLVDSTSRAVATVKDLLDSQPDRGVAAIGSSLAGEIYGLQPLFEKIEDRQGSMTRFLILSKSQAEISGHDKTSIMFSTDDTPGALVNVLSVFKRNSINLTHLDKRPSQKENWDYTFFADLVGHRSDREIAQVIGEARAYCKENGGQKQLTILGSFPASQVVFV